MDEDVFKLLEDHIFQPLGMEQSALLPEFLQTDNVAFPHDEQGQQMQNTYRFVPEIIDYINRMPRFGNAAGTMWASITDYTTFLHHLMFAQHETSSRIRNWMISKQVDLDHPSLGWGLGMGLDQTNNLHAAWHWGSDAGFKTFTYTYLDDATGISIFTNGENGFEVYRELLDLILPETPTFITTNRTL